MGYYDLASGVQAVSTMQTSHGLPTMVGEPVDTRGASSVLFVVNVGTFTSTKDVNLKIQMATDDAFTTPVDITSATFTEYDSSNHERVDIGRVMPRDTLRYVRVHGTATGSGNAPISVTTLLGMDDSSRSGGVSDARTQTQPNAAEFNLQPNDDGS